MDKAKHDTFKALYKKFIDGIRWLDQQYACGIDIEHDIDEFERLVFKPIMELLDTLTEEEREYWEKVHMVTTSFNARVV